MGAPVELRRPVKYAGAAPESPRDAAMTSATLLLTNLMRCVLWLIKHGIYVTGFRGWRGNRVDRVVVTVAASPYLQVLFAGQCAWRERRQDGALTIFTWYAERFSVGIEWEEVVCAA